MELAIFFWNRFAGMQARRTFVSTYGEVTIIMPVLVGVHAVVADYR